MTMARRQAATKTVIPGDNSTPTAEQRHIREGVLAMPASQAATKEGSQNGSHEDSTSCEQIPAGDRSLGKQEASVLTKGSSTEMMLGKGEKCV